MAPHDRAPGTSRRDRLRHQLTMDIVETGRRQLEEGGINAVSWRGIAREVGMNPASLYTYFDGVEDLYTHILLYCFERLAEAISTAAESAALQYSDPRDRLLACAREFRRWALDHPREFNLVYTDQIPGYAAPSDGPTLAAALAVERPFTEAISELLELDEPLDIGLNPNGTALQGEMAERIYTLRALLHGFVTLEINHHAPYLDGSDTTMIAALSRSLDDLVGSCGPGARRAGSAGADTTATP